MTIEIGKQDFATLCICALRYCEGRRSYMPSLVQRIVSGHFDDIDANDLAMIAREEQFQEDMNMWGDSCDKTDWKRFYKNLKEYLRRKEQSDETD